MSTGIGQQQAIKAADQKNFSKHEWIRVINSISGFKSANLLGTVSEQRGTNLAIISSVFHLGSDPALLGFIMRPHSKIQPRHSLQNIIESKQFTLNHVSEAIRQQAHQTSARYAEDESEFAACGLSEEYRADQAAPFVAESPLKISLDLADIKQIELNNTHLVIGSVREVIFDQRYLRKDGYIDLEGLQTVCISGLDAYHSTSRLARYSYAKPDRLASEISLDGEPVSPV